MEKRWLSGICTTGFWTSSTVGLGPSRVSDFDFEMAFFGFTHIKCTTRGRGVSSYFGKNYAKIAFGGGEAERLCEQRWTIIFFVRFCGQRVLSFE